MSNIDKLLVALQPFYDVGEAIVFGEDFHGRKAKNKEVCSLLIESGHGGIIRVNDLKNVYAAIKEYKQQTERGE